MSLKIFDSHSHYTDSAFDADRYELLTRILNDNVGAIMLAGTNVADSLASQKLALEFDGVYSSVGIHPEFASQTEGDYISALEEISRCPKVKAVGEIGLDYHYPGYDENLQKKLFESQLELAKSLDMPVIIHSRDACADTFDILRRYRPKGVVHCFSGSKETAAEAIKLGMYIGLTGVVTFKNARKAREVAESIPLDKLLIETDCPYMAPEPWRSKRCDSSMLVSVASKIAEIRGISVENVIKATSENAFKLYQINK